MVRLAWDLHNLCKSLISFLVVGYCIVQGRPLIITIIVPQRTMQLFKIMWRKQSALISGQKAMQRFYGKMYIDL